MRIHAVKLTLATLAILAIGSLVGCAGSSSGGNGGGPTISSITVTGSAALDLTQTAQYTATGNYSDGSTKDLTSTATWSTSAGSIASVNGSGVATALAAGTARIIATFHAASGFASLTVNAPTSITVTPVGPTIKIGGILQLKATGNFGDGPVDLTDVATWTSSGAASVNSTGNVTAGAAPGGATITATAGKISGSTAISVTNQNMGNGSLGGPSYAFFLTSIDSRGQAIVVGSFTTDGNGNITSGMADFNSAAGTSSSGSVSLTASTYSVMPDGRGEATIALSNGLSYHVAFVLSDPNNSGMPTKGTMISYDKNKAFGTFELQTAGANLNGAYVFAFNGLDAGDNQEAEIGQFSAPSGPGTFDVNDNGVIDGGSNPPPASGQALSPVTIGAVGAGNRGLATLGAAGFAYYTINSTKAYFVENTGSTALAGVAEAQRTAQPLSPENPVSPCDAGGDNVTCNYAFLLNHAASAKNGTFERAGQLNFCACNLNGGIEHAQQDESDGSTWTVTAGSRPFSSPGRGPVQYTVANGEFPGGQQRYAIAYAVSRTPSEVTGQARSRLYMMNTDTSSPGVGPADFIDTLLVANPLPVPGTYVFSATNIGVTNLLKLGLVTFDGGGKASGVSYVNNNGALSVEATGGTFAASNDTSNGGNGRGTLGSPQNPFDATTFTFAEYNVATGGLIVLDTKTHINGRLEPQ